MKGIGRSNSIGGCCGGGGGGGAGNPRNPSHRPISAPADSAAETNAAAATSSNQRRSNKDRGGKAYPAPLHSHMASSSSSSSLVAGEPSGGATVGLVREQRPLSSLSRFKARFQDSDPARRSSASHPGELLP
mmetsp:Transcript_17585/g.35970  ORF Transcript_17585/g.35970 Transcript_17585/m.35970 type:complete len:132 (+) Transcript_17585:1407-1802(+)